MEQNELKNQRTFVKNSKLMKIAKVFAVLFVFLCLALLGVFTFINYKNIEKNEQTSNLFQKGMQIRNTYETLTVKRIPGNSYSQFPYRLLEIRSDENTMYSYRDDFYKDYSEPETTIDRDKKIIYLSERQVFDNPITVAEQPECEAMAKIESQKRQPESYEDMPIEINLKYLNKQDSGKKVYVYSPKLGHCKRVFSDNRLLRVRSNAISIRYNF
jgi:hypothetical protein